MTAILTAFEDLDYLCLSGYPITKNKQVKAINDKEEHFEGYTLSYAVRPKQLVDFSKFNKDENLHIAFSYQQKGTDAENQKRKNAPKPTGMSGGGLWIVPDSFNSSDVYIAGIIIEYYKNDSVGFATKTDRIIEYIRQHFNNT